VAELVASTRRFHSDVTDAATLAGIEMTEHVDAASHSASPTVDRFVAERVGESLHGMTRRDRVSVEVQLAMDLDERHRTAVAREHGQTP
jgi:hypothetical protein